MHRIRRYSVVLLAGGMLVGGLMVSGIPPAADLRDPLHLTQADGGNQILKRVWASQIAAISGRV